MEELYNSLFEAGDYTGSFEDFKEQFGDDEKSKVLYKALNDNGEYTKSIDEFNTQFGFSSAEDFQTDDAVSANAKSQEGVIALKDTELAPVDTSLESQSMDPFVINGEKVSEQEFKEYQKDLAKRDVLEENESFFSATGFVDFFSDIATAAEEGWRQGELVDPSYELYKLGGDSTDEDVLNFINKNKEIARKNLGSAEMQDFNRIYEEEGGGFWGFIKGVVNNPSTLSTMLVSSISNQISSLRSDEVRAAGAAAAATGAVAGSAIPLPGVSTLGGAIAGGMGGTMGAMETGLTFAELLQEEAGGLDPDKIKKILKDPEKLADLKNRALNRGLAIAAVEMATLGIAKGVGGKLATAGFKRAPMVAAGVTGGIEIAGGGLGEVAGRYVADQEMDVAEIGFEAFAGLGSAPVTLGQQALNIQTNLDRVKVNKEINRTEYGNIVDVFKPETKTDNAEIKISKIKNSRKILNEKVDAQVKRAEITKEEGDAIKKNFIKTQGTVNQVNSLNLSEDTEVKVVELQKEKSSLEAQIKKVNDKALTGTQSERVDAINKEQQSIIKEDIFTSRTKAATELATGLEFKEEPKVFNTTEEYIKAIAKEEGMSDKQASEAAKGSNGAFIGKGRIFIDKKIALEQGAVSVANHEVLHPILNAVIGDINKQKAILDDFKSKLSKKQIDWVQGQLDANVNLADHDSEFLTYFSEGILNQQIKYDENVFTKLKDVVSKVFRKLGYNNIKFESGKDVYNFLKEYNNSILKNDKIQTSQVLKAIKSREAEKGVKASEVDVVKRMQLSKTNQEKIQSLEQELDTLEENEFDYDPGDFENKRSNLQYKINQAKKPPVKKPTVKKEKTEKEETTKKTYNNEALVETIKSKETTRKDKVAAESELVESFDTMALKAIKYDTRKGDLDRTEVRDYLRQFLPKIIESYKPGESKFSTWVYNNIAPKAQQTYERFKKIADKSLDVEAGGVGSVAEVASTNDTKSVETTKKPSRKLKPIDLIRDPELKQKYRDAIEKVVKSGEVDIEDATFGNLKDLAPEVTAEIFDIPLLKVTDPADNLAFADIIVSDKNLEEVKKYYPDAKVGMIIKSESSKIQDVIKSMGPDLFKLMPPSNAAPELASVDAQAYRGVKGTGLKIPTSLMKTFYEATGKRSKGITSQVVIKELKKDITYEQFLQDLGIKKGEANKYDRKIGQRLKAMTMLFGKLATNTEVRQLEGVTDVQKQNIGSGKSDIQFSLTKEGLNLLKKHGIKDRYNAFNKNTDIDKYINDIVKLTKVFNTDEFKIFNATVLQFTKKAIKDKSKRNYLRDKLAELKKDKTLEARLEVGRTPFAKFLGNSVDAIKTKTLSKPGRLKKYNEKHRKVFDQMWNKINTILSNKENRDLALPIMYFLENAINERSNPMSMGALAIAAPTKGSKVIWDHAFPQTQAFRFLLDSILDKNNSFKEAFARVKENYYAIALTKADQKKVDDARSSKSLEEDEQWYDRLVNAGVDLSKYTYFGPDGTLSKGLDEYISSSFSKTFKNENKVYDLGLEPSSNHESLLEIQFSKNKRKDYEDVLSKKRPELKDIPKQVDELFKWADGLKIPDNKKSKYKKLALYYTANGYTIFPEDGYKIEEAIRLSEINKIDPYAYGNPDELITKFTKEEKARRINPDTVKEFTNKRSLPEGVTIYDVDDSKAGQRAVRKVADSNWGEEFNGWCLIARDKRADQRYMNFETEREAEEYADEMEDLGWTTEIHKLNSWEYEVYADLMNDDASLDNAWKMWKHYNEDGYGYELAFQNGKLISFKDGSADGNYWDRFDKATDTLQINLGKKDGLTTRGEIYYDEFTNKPEVELVGYGEGDFMGRKGDYKLYNDSKEVIEAKVYKDGKISESVKNTPTRINDGGRARETTTTKYENGEVISTEKIIKDLRTGEVVTRSTVLNERINESSYIENSIIVGVNGKSPKAPKVTEKNIRLIDKRQEGLDRTVEYYAERITDGVSDVVIDRMSELNKIQESTIQFSKSVEKAKKSNNNMLPKSKRLEGDFTMDQVLDEMRSLDDQQTEAGIQFSNGLNLDRDFNDILEKKSGIASDKEFQRVKAETVGASKGRFKFFVPPSAEDFVGLLYATLGKGKTGDTQMAWYKKVLLNPYARAMENISRDRNALGRDFKELKKKLKIVPKDLKKKVPGDVFTKEQAVRVWIWNQIGKDVPGLDKSDIDSLVKYVDSNPDLKIFGTEIMKLNKGAGYISPTDSWNTGTITTDLLETLNTNKRKKYLELWQQNVDIIFSEKNLNKLEAIYGKQYRMAMENMLKRMKTGRNRSTGVDSLTTRVTDWLTGSIGAIMFFNTRSAFLQTLSAVNFINFGDNNILAAGKAFANQKQYWTDFKKLFNSEFLVERRDGLKMNVNEADIADIAKERGVRGVINRLLKIGFTPTQIADSFAIASGGATFYRNRVKSLMKQGKSSMAAEREALRDFREIAEESQQSSRPDRISQQQAGPLGRIILAFANTPAQYARLIKKAASDLKNGRGDAKTNISKIIYYGVAQNLIFNALQQALFAVAFGEDEEEDDKKVVDVANGMVDSILRGTGIGGAVFSVIKNAGMKLAKENAKDNPKYENATAELLKLSPPISSKYGKVKAALRSYSWDEKEMKEKGFSLDNPAYLAGANVVSATTNVPLDRVIKKVNNITASTQEDISVAQRIALLAGWSEWQLGIKKSKKSKSRKNVRGKTSKKRVLN
tara:strand:- start:108 stop:8234 length:8127 start_codon:yes stop_codon:yes gene_type:complete